MSLKVSYKENNVVYLTAKSNLICDIEKVFNEDTSLNHKVDLECQENDFEYDEEDPLDMMVNDLIVNNYNYCKAEDIETAATLFEFNMMERQTIIYYIPNRVSKISLCIGTVVGDSVIAHSPIQCSDIQLVEYAREVAYY